MKKIFFLITTLSFISIQAFSQDKKNIKKAFVNVGAQTSLAAGDIKDTHSFGLGANVQGGYRVNNTLAITARVSYTHLFGKKVDHYYYEPGGGGNHSERHEGMNDIGITGGGRFNFNENWFGGLEGGLCLDSGGGHSETAGMGSFEFGYGFHCHQSPLEQAVAFFFGVCGDPKIQIGLRYSIRL
jgi:hypothetical protein